MTKRVSFSDVVTIRRIVSSSEMDQETKERLFYNAKQLRQQQLEQEQETAMAMVSSSMRRDLLLAQKTADVRARTAKILERRRARQRLSGRTTSNTATTTTTTAVPAQTQRQRRFSIARVVGVRTKNRV